LRVAVVALLGLFAQLLRSDSTAPPLLHYRTGIGERLTVPLADGSTIELNTQTSVEVHVSAQFRRVRLLSGEVYFRVAHRPLPFEVFAGAIKVQDLATEFDVYRKDKTTTVAVTEGRVRVIDSAQERALRAPDSPSSPTPLAHLQVVGTALELTSGAEVEVSDNLSFAAKDLSARDLLRLVAWREGRVDFYGASLIEAVIEMQRYNPVAFIIHDPSTEHIRIGGGGRGTDLEGFLEALHEHFGIDSASATNTQGLRVITLSRPAKKDSHGPRG
jgi:transmembrane sensor